MFNLIKENEREMIINYIKADREYWGQELESFETIFAAWAAEKSEYLFKTLDNQLILSKEINIQDEALIVHKLDKAIGGHYFRGNINVAIANNEFEIQFKGDGVKSASGYRWVITRTLLDANNLIDKIKDSDYFTPYKIIFKSGHTVQVDVGTRPMRVLKKIAEECGVEGYEDFRLKHSMILNDRKTYGILCLSIHPLDYMTMSDNKCNWSSCMNWAGPGEFRAGTIEMMNSSMVVEAYLKASEDMEMPGGGTWNNKKWRELFIVHPSVILGIKGYPFQSKGLEKLCLDWLKELVEKNLGWKYCDETEQYSNDAGSNGLSFETDYMYNDVYDLHNCYYHYPVEEIEREYINYSGPFTCMVCGSTEKSEGPTCAITCDDHSPYHLCVECGEWYLESEMVEFEGELYCESCYECLPTCAGCGERFSHYDDKTTHYTIIYKDRISYEYQLPLCDSCLEEGKLVDKKKMVKITARDIHWGIDEQYKGFFFEDLTAEGQYAFFNFIRNRYGLDTEEAILSWSRKNVNLKFEPCFVEQHGSSIDFL